jgi:DNA-binding PadR family transcriptional regulator
MLRAVLLALLAKEPRHGYDLKQTFERLLAGTWPLNIGQVYTTLSRLERDGLVRAETTSGAQAPDRRVYTLTPAGHEELSRWLDEPMDEPVPLKQEVFAKILVQQIVGDREPYALIWRQREVYLRLLAELTERQDAAGADSTTGLLLEGAILHVEADLRWLDVCEERLRP